MPKSYDRVGFINNNFMKKIKRITLVSSVKLSETEMKNIIGCEQPKCDAQALVCSGSCVTKVSTLGYCGWHYISTNVKLCACNEYIKKTKL